MALIVDVLLAEDDPDAQTRISTYLRNAGCQITIANNGLEALKVASKHSFDCIIINMQIPFLSGIDLTKVLRASGYEGFIVALTSDSLENTKQHCQAAGCNDTISSPVNQAELTTLLHKLLTKQSSPIATSNTLTSSLLEEEPGLTDLVKVFIEKLPKVITPIEAAYDDQNWEALKQLTHNLKSTAGNYGFMPLSEEASKITIHNFENPDIHFIASTMDNIKTLSEQIIAGGEALQKSSSEDKKSGIP